MNKLFELGARVYNNKMKIENNEDGTVKYSDDEAIRALCAKIFDKDGNISFTFTTYGGTTVNAIYEKTNTEANIVKRNMPIRKPIHPNIQM